MDSTLSKRPLISVFMPVYNGQDYLVSSINSILNQTYTNIELLIVDDGSTDSSIKIIEGFTDNRIKLFRNPVNQGLVFTRNKGLSLSSGKYLALIDCDDIAFLNRLELQFQFLEAHPEYACCGGRGDMIDKLGKKIGAVDVPFGYRYDFLLLSLFSNPIINSSAMFLRSAILDLRYSNNMEPVEDFDFIIHFMQKHKMYNLSNRLVLYRIHEANTSFIKRDLSKVKQKLLLKSLLDYFKVKFTQEELDIHHTIFSKTYTQSNYPYSNYIQWIQKLYLMNVDMESQDILQKILVKKTMEISYHFRFLRIADTNYIVPSQVNQLKYILFVISKLFLKFKNS